VDSPSKNRRWRRWVNDNPKKRSAQSAVSAAIASGALVEPDPPACESCGTVTRLVAHHENYDLQLDVNWICHHCHYWLHEGVSPAPPRTRPAPPPRQRKQRKKSARKAGRPRAESKSRRKPNFYRCEATPLRGLESAQCTRNAEHGKRFCDRHQFWRADDKRKVEKKRK
jgi:hypothetical protein